MKYFLSILFSIVLSHHIQAQDSEPVLENAEVDLVLKNNKTGKIKTLYGHKRNSGYCILP